MSLVAVGALWAGWVGSGLVLEATHRRRLASVPCRVLVGGVRGKSTLVRLLHAGLRHSGRTTLGRITGDAPTLLLPDGSEAPSPRRARALADVREMRGLFRLPNARGIDALVAENMAIRLDLQEIVGRRMVLPTLQVLAADAPDHLEHYPADRAERATRILETLDPRVPLLITPSPCNAELIDRAARGGFALVDATPLDDARLRPHMQALMGAALGALAHLGLRTDDCTAFLVEEALRLQRLPLVELPSGLRVFDLLSTNDPASTLSLTRLAEKELVATPERCVLVYVHRSDRLPRLLSFLPLFRVYRGMVVGDRPPRSVRRALRTEWRATPDWDALAECDLVYLAGCASKTGKLLREELARIGARKTW